jgi:hypothetical protein
LYPKGGDLQRVAALPEYNLADFWRWIFETRKWCIEVCGLVSKSKEERIL